MTSADSVAAWAASGVVPLTGWAHGPPLRPPGAAALAARRLMQSFAALAEALDTAVQLDGAALLGERAAFTGGRRAGAVSVGGGCRLIPAADGLLAVSLPRARTIRCWPGRWSGRSLPARRTTRVARWAPGPTGRGGRRRGRRTRPGHQRGRRTSLSTWRRRRSRPRCCAVSPALTCRHGAASAGPLSRPASAPLVVDFSALWAGPLCAQLLGLAGARVIKVEAPKPAGRCAARRPPLL